MKKITLILGLAAMVCPGLSQAQSSDTRTLTADDEAIKNVVSRETEGYCKKDSATWMTTYVMDSATIRTTVNSGGVYTFRGWQQFGPAYLAYFRESPKPFTGTPVDSNYAIAKSGDLAFVEYDQSLTYRAGDSAEISHELRTLKRMNGEWKIISSTTISRTSFSAPDSAAIEDNLNAIGYRLLLAGKYDAAIKVFALNVKMSPKSWNVFDSIGEAYMKSGNKQLAIQNYQTSMKLNPKNDNGAKMLAELKKK